MGRYRGSVARDGAMNARGDARRRQTQCLADSSVGIAKWDGSFKVVEGGIGRRGELAINR